MARINDCSFAPDERPPAGEGSFTLVLEADIRNGALLNGVDVTWNVGTQYDGTLHYDPSFAKTTRVPANSTVTDTWMRTFGNVGGQFFPGNREVEVVAFIEDEQAVAAEAAAPVRQPRRTRRR